MYRDNMEELRMKKKKEKVKRKNDSPLDFSNKKKKKGTTVKGSHWLVWLVEAWPLKGIPRNLDSDTVAIPGI